MPTAERVGFAPLLDVDTKNLRDFVFLRFRRIRSKACISVVTKAELMYGVEVSPRHDQDAASLAAFLPYVEALA